MFDDTQRTCEPEVSHVLASGNTMPAPSRAADIRFWFTAGTAALSGFLGLLTIVWHDWLEAFGWEPDGGNGLVEWFIAAGLLAIALATGAAARGQIRRAAAERG
jgi:hypothetical protein